MKTSKVCRISRRNSGDTIPISENWVMSPKFPCPRISILDKAGGAGVYIDRISPAD